MAQFESIFLFAILLLYIYIYMNIAPSVRFTYWHKVPGVDFINTNIFQLVILILDHIRTI